MVQLTIQEAAKEKLDQTNKQIRKCRGRISLVAAEIPDLNPAISPWIFVPLGAFHVR